MLHCQRLGGNRNITLLMRPCITSWWSVWPIHPMLMNISLELRCLVLVLFVHVCSVAWRVEVIANRPTMTIVSEHFEQQLLFINSQLKLCLVMSQFNYLLSTYLHFATSKMWCWSGGRRTLTKLSLCPIAYYYNGVQWYYEQFFGRLDRALIWLDLALCLPSASIFYPDDAVYI